MRAESFVMITYITFLRALAACFITNAHYTGIYPTDMIANGGLLGDVIFFAVSGYCLFEVKDKFTRWYEKRIVRIYVPVLVVTGLYIFLQAYKVTEDTSLFWWLVYPTNYHFIASIIILYIPFYIVAGTGLKTKIPQIMIAVAEIYVLVYLIDYDKSYYHIDTVREPMIRFLFGESMLLGAWFRQNDDKYRNKCINMKKSIFVIVSVFVIYFASKMLFSRMDSLSVWQAINQLALFILLYLLLRFFAAVDRKLEHMPPTVMKTVTFIANIALEIYLVQYVLIARIRGHFAFPINWLVLTGTILIGAIILHKISKRIVDVCMRALKLT